MNYKKICSLALFLVCIAYMAQSQTYNINTATNPDVGGMCPLNSGIDASFNCFIAGGAAIDIGSFMDTNAAGATLTSISVETYSACNGDVELFLNGVSLATQTLSGLSCSCQSISGDPNIPQSFTITLTPAIAAAYVLGGMNTLSLSATSAGSICIYGADVTVTVPAACDPSNGTFTIN